MTFRNQPQPSGNDPGLVTTAEAARFLSCSESGVYSLLRRGLLQRVKLGPRMTRVQLRELQALAGVRRD